LLCLPHLHAYVPAFDADVKTVIIDLFSVSHPAYLRHVAHGGVAQSVASLLLASGQAVERFVSRSALGYPSGLYGSQTFHRRECGLDPASILDFLATQDS
jgi:hypothetical protein